MVRGGRALKSFAARRIKSDAQFSSPWRSSSWHFFPVFALTGQEGKLFHPLAFTKTFAMIGATLLGVTLVPVLCTWLVRGPFRAENEKPGHAFC